MELAEEKSSILIVDDDKHVRDFLTTLFKNSGYICHAASDGKEALEKAETTLPDIIFCDLFMTGMNGLDTCKKLKTNPGTSSIPVIIITSSDDYDIKIKCLGAGASDFITKPINPLEITIKTRNFLRLNKYAKIKIKNSVLQETIKKIEQAKKEWEQTVDSLNDIIILIDPKDKILRTNKTLSDITNIKYPDLLGRKWREVLQDNGFTYSIYDSGDIEFYHTSNKFFNYNISSWTSEKTNQSVSVIILQDITELKQLTQNIEENRHILERKNQELEKAYSKLKSAQSQILQQEKMASIGQLAAGVAHEINNPTGFIMSNLNTLMKYSGRIREFAAFQTEALEALSKDIPSRNEMLEKLREKRKATKFDHVMSDIDSLISESLEGAERIKRIVQDLKSFSRVDEAENKLADINAGIDSTINIIWNELKYKTSIKKEYGEIPKTRCDAGQLNQVFMNILINAAQAIEKRGEIKIRTWHEADNIYISISDTGTGIPEDKINRIFEPFFTTKDVGQGTGLGLSIVYDIIQKHNGDIGVESKLGIGTTFNIRIPVISSTG